VEDINKQIETEVNKQMQSLKTGTITEIEKEKSTFTTYTTIVLAIIAIAVAVWAALGIINAVDSRKINQLENSYKILKKKLDEDTKIYEQYITRSKLQEKKIALLSITTLANGPRKVLIFVLNGRLDTHISYSEIDEVIKDMFNEMSSSFLNSSPKTKESIESGESRNRVITNIKTMFFFIKVIDTGNGYIFSIPDIEYKNLYVQASAELEQSILLNKTN
jgi:hypothetical protein